MKTAQRRMLMLLLMPIISEAEEHTFPLVDEFEAADQASRVEGEGSFATAGDESKIEASELERGRVRGHQDTKCDLNFPPQAIQINILADRLAAAALVDFRTFGNLHYCVLSVARLPSLSS